MDSTADTFSDEITTSPVRKDLFNDGTLSNASACLALSFTTGCTLAVLPHVTARLLGANTTLAHHIK
jgi:hypothetical protein